MILYYNLRTTFPRLLPRGGIPHQGHLDQLAGPLHVQLDIAQVPCAKPQVFCEAKNVESLEKKGDKFDLFSKKFMFQVLRWSYFILFVDANCSWIFELSHQEFWDYKDQNQSE